MLRVKIQRVKEVIYGCLLSHMYTMALLKRFDSPHTSAEIVGCSASLAFASVSDSKNLQCLAFQEKFIQTLDK